MFLLLFPPFSAWALALLKPCISVLTAVPPAIPGLHFLTALPMSLDPDPQPAVLFLYIFVEQQFENRESI